MGTPGLARPPKLRTPSRLPTGPRAFHQPAQKIAGPGPVPPGFVRGKNSASEWPPYWALATIFGLPRDPRAGPPFQGAWPFWTYQEYATGPTYSGDVNIDFFVHHPPRGRAVAIRIQTERYHLFVDNRKQIYDRLQAMNLSGAFDVVDIYEDDYLNEPTGQAIVVLIKNAIGLLRSPDPILVGTARRASRGAL